MFTSIDKALIAVFMGVIYILQANNIVLPDFLTEAWVQGLVGVLTPVAVYLWPNKEA